MVQQNRTSDKLYSALFAKVISLRSIKYLKFLSNLETVVKIFKVGIPTPEWNKKCEENIQYIHEKEIMELS